MKKISNIISIILLVLIVGISIFTYIGISKKEVVKEEIVKVTFNTNGGNVINAVETEKYTPVKKPEDPKKEGFTFERWELDGKEFDFNKIVNKNIELNAIYKTDYTKLEGIDIEDLIKVNLNSKEKFTMPVKFIPENATNKKMTYKVMNPAVATIDENGVVTPLKVGKTNVTLVSDEGYRGTTMIQVVNVKEEGEVNNGRTRN